MNECKVEQRRKILGRIHLQIIYGSLFRTFISNTHPDMTNLQEVTIQIGPATQTHTHTHAVKQLYISNQINQI